MKQILFFILTGLVLSCFSCKQKDYPKIELNLTSGTNDSFCFIRSFFLARLPLNPSLHQKSYSFSNIECKAPNKFVFKYIDKGVYTGLLKIEKDYSVYNISIDSIIVKDGLNVISQEINLGSIKIPD